MKNLGGEECYCFSNSHLVVNQIKGGFQTKGNQMVKYLAKVQNSLKKTSLSFEYPT